MNYWLHRQIWYATHGDTKWRIPAILALIGIAAFALWGCASTDLVKRADVKAVRVTWIKEKPATCGGAANAQACATRAPGYHECLIEMPEDATDAVIAEEFRHCFGWEHIGDTHR